MNFFKTSFWASLATGVTMLSGLITTKYVAILIGPEGMAYTGQFANVTVVLALLATGACVTGIVKYLSEHKDEETRKKILSNALILAGICVSIISIVVIAFSKLLAEKAFNSTKFSDVFVMYGLLLAFPTFNSIALAVFNGLQQIKLIAFVNICAAILNVVFVIVLAKFFGLKGILIASSVSAFFSFFISLYFLNKKSLLRK